MPTLPDQRALKQRLPRTWPAFFERHGSFSATQVAAIPLVLDGSNVVVCAATASGKTAAVLAPLIERHCPAVRPPHTLRILYLVPTRALVNDLRHRLEHPLQTLGITLGVKTRDNTFRANRPPDLLLATPEAVDSLLAGRASLFRQLRAIVIDELHLFDGTPRGDQLRVLLNRLCQVRRYAAAQGQASDEEVQYVALSATLGAPEQAAARYFPRPLVVAVPGTRQIAVEYLDLAPGSGAELLAYVATFRARGWRKALAFCTSRAEVEAYAAIVRAASPFGSAVYVHYSNIEPQRRHEIEQQFASNQAAICFASNTLELGIDIGDIDVVILIGPPGSVAAFAQRLGRGSRRRAITQVACCSRSLLERLIFEGLLSETERQGDKLAGAQEASPDSIALSPLRPIPASYHVRPAIAVQQIFSLLKQSPIAALRLAPLAELFADMLTPADLEAIFAHLQRHEYLHPGRPGEWRAGPRLNALFDEQNRRQVELSIYSNIQTSSSAQVAVRDQATGQVVAQVDAWWLDREVLTLEGRPVQIEWYDGEALWVNTAQQRQAVTAQPYRSARQLLSYDVARLLPAQLGLPPDSAPFVVAPAGWVWFHCLGDLYGKALVDLLRYRSAAAPSDVPGLALHLSDEPQAPPTWEAAQVVRYLHDTYRQYENLLDLGPFQHLLPTTLRRRSVVAQFDVPRFLAAVAQLRPLVAAEQAALELMELLSDAKGM
jgi:ATP-dependent Lhr-like helicase